MNFVYFDELEINGTGFESLNGRVSSTNCIDVKI